MPAVLRTAIDESAPSPAFHLLDVLAAEAELLTSENVRVAPLAAVEKHLQRFGINYHAGIAEIIDLARRHTPESVRGSQLCRNLLARLVKEILPIKRRSTYDNNTTTQSQPIVTTSDWSNRSALKEKVSLATRLGILWHRCLAAGGSINFPNLLVTAVSSACIAWITVIIADKQYGRLPSTPTQVIRADNSPTKVTPVGADANAKPANGRFGDRSTSEQLVRRDEEPVDVSLSNHSGVRSADMAGASPGATVPALGGPASPGGPKRVRAVSVQADQRASPSWPFPAAADAEPEIAGAGESTMAALPIPPATPPVHMVTSGDTLVKIAHKYRVGVREIAIANGIAPKTPLKVGTQLTIPVKVAAMRHHKPQPGTSELAQGPTAAAPGKLASNETAANVRLASPIETPSAEAGPNGAPAFRWPARGRIIANFGARVDGSPNDGIDLALPEGTMVRAAQDGVVAYAGNEMKGYGNLVLVRHANGFVTGYANASELLVRRNDQVHKGQVILKSGQTGNAATPQLHFEIRKNSAPVDPMQYLPEDKTALSPL
jgi:murein DD-endopeptidase MepM/ murein hydrolase activator NlpD